jgi:hypothetical protein
MGQTATALKSRGSERMAHDIKITTDAPGLPSHKKLSGFRSKEVVETQAEVMSVALNQPHRRDIKDGHQSKAGSRALRILDPLGRFCQANKLDDALWEAGRQYGEVCRQGKAAKGFATYQAREQGQGGATLTDAQIKAMNDVAVRRWADAEGVLRQIMGRLPRVMELLCFDEREPSPYDEAVLTQGLLRLALHFGTLKLGINAGKALSVAHDMSGLCSTRSVR